MNALSSEIDILKQEITTKETEVNALYDLYISQAEGRAGTEILGKGPVYEEKREKHDAALADLSELKKTNTNKVTSLETIIADVSTEYQAKVNETQPVIDDFDGLMARVNALNELPWLPSFFTFLLFLAIGTSPIFAKLLAPKGVYDLKLEEQENAVKTWNKQQAQQRVVLFETDTSVSNRVYADIAEEQELYDYKRKRARELMQLQADAFYKKQKSIL